MNEWMDGWMNAWLSKNSLTRTTPCVLRLEHEFLEFCRPFRIFEAVRWTLPLEEFGSVAGLRGRDYLLGERQRDSKGSSQKRGVSPGSVKMKLLRQTHSNLYRQDARWLSRFVEDFMHCLLKQFVGPPLLRSVHGHDANKLEEFTKERKRKRYRFTENRMHFNPM